jgi:hypothetical protein
MNPQSPSVPPPTVAATEDTGTVTRPWYLYFAAVHSRMDELKGAVLGWSGLLHQGRIAKVSNSSGTIAEASFTESDVQLLLSQQRTVTDQTLTAASTTINAPAVGQDWVVILRQDATGGRAIVWGAGIKATAANIDTTASTVSTFRFVKSGSDWVMAGQPTTGMTYC